MGWGVLALSLLCANAAGAMSVVFQEDFETDGDGVRYDLIGGGQNGVGIWGLQDGLPDLGFSGFEGSDFVLGINLDSGFGGGITPRALELPLSPIDLSGATSATLRILLGANQEGTWDAGQDYLRIIVIDAQTTNEFVLEEFLPNAGGNLESLAGGGNPGTILDYAMAEILFDLPSGIDMLEIRIEAMSTSTNERLAIDGIEVVTTVPEPETALLVTLGILAMLTGRRAGMIEVV